VNSLTLPMRGSRECQFTMKRPNRQKRIGTYRSARKIVVTVVGGTVLLAGICLLILPGPAIVVIPIGLAILGLEYAWARRFLRRMRGRKKSGQREENEDRL